MSKIVQRLDVKNYPLSSANSDQWRAYFKIVESILTKLKKLQKYKPVTISIYECLKMYCFKMFDKCSRIAFISLKKMLNYVLYIRHLPVRLESLVMNLCLFSYKCLLFNQLNVEKKRIQSLSIIVMISFTKYLCHISTAKRFVLHPA